MRLRPISVGILLLVSSGCASVSDVDTALKKPAAAAKSASDVATQSELDVVKLVALGSARYDGSLEIATLICNPASGPDVAISNLTTFSSALTTIDDVAAKPKDTSYGALLGKIGEDDKAAAKNYEEDRRKSVKERDQDRERCAELFTADVDPTTRIHVPPPGEAAAAVAAAAATFAAIDSLAKSILGAYEQAKRDEAIKATIKHLLPQMEDAVTSLRAPRNDAFGAQVAYQTSGAAQQMDRTAFGATITLHRWWTAMSIMGRWNELAPCRNFSYMTDCVKNPRMQAAADDLAAAVLQYRSLAKIDADKVIDALQKGVDRTKSSVDGKSIKDIFDGLSEIGGALGDVGKSYSAYEKARG
jgi:hypothetical protein